MAGRSLLFECHGLLNSIMELLVRSSTLLTADIDAFAVQYGLWAARSEAVTECTWCGPQQCKSHSCIRGRSVPFRARRKGAHPPTRTKPFCVGNRDSRSATNKPARGCSNPLGSQARS